MAIIKLRVNCNDWRDSNLDYKKRNRRDSDKNSENNT